MTVLLDGRPVAREIIAEVQQGVQSHVRATGRAPGLAALIVGEDAAGDLYLRRLEQAAGRVGMVFHRIDLPARTSEVELRRFIAQANGDRAADGVIVQMPLPPHLSAQLVAETLAPHKDVEGITFTNAGRLLAGLAGGFVPSTPLGGIELLRRYRVPIAGARAVVVGRSLVVGKPMALLLLAEQATVTICHRGTTDLAAHTREADLLAVAAGHPGLVTGAMLKPGAAVVDFGTNVTPAGLVGDVDFPSAVGLAGWLTPVPGGTGPVTNAVLLRNVLEAARRNAET